MLGIQEVILILAILLLVFGPAELPKIARELGRIWYEFNKASSGVMEALSSADTTKNKIVEDVKKKLDETTERKND